MASIDDLNALVDKHRLWEAGMRGESDGAAAVAEQAAAEYRASLRECGLFTRLICLALDALTRRLDAMTRRLQR